jgi:hypothetical protein
MAIQANVPLIRYDASQSLTMTQKMTALTNVGLGYLYNDGLDGIYLHTVYFNYLLAGTRQWYARIIVLSPSDTPVTTVDAPGEPWTNVGQLLQRPWTGENANNHYGLTIGGWYNDTGGQGFIAWAQTASNYGVTLYGYRFGTSGRTQDSITVTSMTNVVEITDHVVPLIEVS